MNFTKRIFILLTAIALLFCSCESNKGGNHEESVSDTESKAIATLDSGDETCSCGFEKNHKHIMLCGALYVDYGSLSKQQNYTEDEIEFIGTLKSSVPDGEDPTEDEEGNFDCVGLRYGIYKPHKVYGEIISWEGSCVVEQADGTLHVYYPQVNPGSTVPDPFKETYYTQKMSEPTEEEYKTALENADKAAVEEAKKHIDADGSADLSNYEISNAFFLYSNSAYFNPIYFIFKDGKCIYSLSLVKINGVYNPTFGTDMNEYVTKVYEEKEPFALYFSSDDNGNVYFVTASDAFLISGDKSKDTSIPRDTLTMNRIEAKPIE